jgi:NAD(P)-dependent dehydrogenase (short-subunit alcohol dehydrogenase family)
LGRLIAEAYATKGVKGVAVLDVKVPEQGAERAEWEERGIRWYECDVGRREEVEQSKTRF